MNITEYKSNVYYLMKQTENKEVKRLLALAYRNRLKEERRVK